MYRPLSHALRLGCVALLTPALAACGGADTGWAGTVRDSAGIEIVTSPPQGIWGDDRPWTFEEVLRVGGSSATENAALFAAVTSAGTDDAGRLYVFESQAQEVRIFDADGSHVETVGGRGQGPGELRGGVAVLVRDDGQFYVPDIGNGRINVYGLADEPTSIPFRVLQEGTRSAPARWILGPDERILIQLRTIPIGQAGAAAPVVDGDPIVAYDPSGGAPPDTIATLPPGLTLEQGGGPLGFRMKIFAPEPIWAIFDDGVIAQAMNNEYRIQFRNLEGDVARIVEKAVEKRPVTEQDQEQLRGALRETMEQGGAPPQMLDAMTQMLSFAETYPAFANFMAGPEHTLWVQHVKTVAEMEMGISSMEDLQRLGSPDWDVFDREGRFLGSVSLPDGFLPLDWSGDDLIGVIRDELDVPAVVRMRLVRG